MIFDQNDGNMMGRTQSVSTKETYLQDIIQKQKEISQSAEQRPISIQQFTESLASLDNEYN